MPRGLPVFLKPASPLHPKGREPFAMTSPDRDHAEHQPAANRPDNPSSAEVQIAVTTDPETLDIQSLVLSATGISHHIQHADAGMAIYVPQSLAEKARHELAAYIQENQLPRDLQEGQMPFVPTFRALAPLLVGSLILMYGVTGGWQADSPWFIHGAGDSRAILEDHQFYRLITPLTLHADLVHLLSNSILGVFLLHFFFHLTGNGIGLAALLASAASANLLNVMVHGPGHLFVGFSTATFSVIGMLCTMNYIGKSGFRLFLLMPIMAGLALLALLGSSGERTDLGGHFFGLLSGLGYGNLARLPYFSTLRASLIVQTLLGAAALAVLLGCWLLALS